jgi:hypothetical protein
MTDTIKINVDLMIEAKWLVPVTPRNQVLEQQEELL